MLYITVKEVKLTELKDYHYAWLSAHPERDTEWLRAHLSDGFDIHHIDGDHTNNIPTNLVLIDSADHLFLHNSKTRVIRKAAKGYRSSLSISNEVHCGLIHALRSSGIPWRTIAADNKITIAKARRMYDRHILNVSKVISVPDPVSTIPSVETVAFIKPRIKEKNLSVYGKEFRDYLMTHSK